MAISYCSGGGRLGKGRCCAEPANMGQTNMGQTNMGQTNMGQTNMGQSNMAQSNTGWSWRHWVAAVAQALLVVVLAGGVLAQGGAAPEADRAAAAWAALDEGGVVVLMRHATAPGGGDPPAFRLGDCATQRNLSAAGRAQAQRIGEELRRRGIAIAAVYSSQWCRCLETARLMGVAAVQEQPLLNSTFATPEVHAAQMADLRRWLAGLQATAPVILVTHQVVITGLTGVFPGSGEMVVLRRDGDRLEVVGRIAPPAP